MVYLQGGEIHLNKTNNVNGDGGLDIPEAWMPTIKKQTGEWFYCGLQKKHHRIKYCTERNLATEQCRIEMPESQPTIEIQV